MATITNITATTGTTSTAFLTSSAFSAAVGDMIVLFVAADNAGSGGASSISSVSAIGSNSFVSQGVANNDPGAAAAGVTVQVFICQVVSAITSTAATVNFSPNTTSKVVWGYVITPGSGEALSVASSPAGTTGTSTSPSSGAINVEQNNIIFAGVGAETNATPTAGDTDTTNGSWSTANGSAANTGTAGTSIRGTAQHKTATASGNQSWDITFGASVDWAVKAVVISTSPSDGNVRDAGVWKPFQLSVRDAGVWKPATQYVRDAGVWKQTR